MEAFGWGLVVYRGWKGWRGGGWVERGGSRERWE